jgi:hypothetical protein
VDDENRWHDVWWVAGRGPSNIGCGPALPGAIAGQQPCRLTLDLGALTLTLQCLVVPSRHQRCPKVGSGQLSRSFKTRITRSAAA